MEILTRLVSESLARHGFDRPVDYRRLQWSRWFRCESPHSLLLVPSKPGVFALAEEVVDFGANQVATAASAASVATGALPVPRSEASGLAASLIAAIAAGPMRPRLREFTLPRTPAAATTQSSPAASGLETAAAQTAALHTRSS